MAARRATFPADVRTTSLRTAVASVPPVSTALAFRLGLVALFAWSGPAQFGGGDGIRIERRGGQHSLDARDRGIGGDFRPGDLAGNAGGSRRIGVLRQEIARG